MVAWRYEFYFLMVRNNIIFTHSLHSFVNYCFYHSKIKFISSRHRVISSIYISKPNFNSHITMTNSGAFVFSFPQMIHYLHLLNFADFVRGINQRGICFPWVPKVSLACFLWNSHWPEADQRVSHERKPLALIPAIYHYGWT